MSIFSRSLFLAVSVGYEYESCPDLILWEKRTAVLQGYETDASKLGGWSLDKHHALNIQSGTLAFTPPPPHLTPTPNWNNKSSTELTQFQSVSLLFTINNSAKTGGKATDTHTLLTNYSS